MCKIINVGLIGYGTGGRFFHAPIINSINGLSLIKIVTSKEATKQLINDTYPNVQVVPNIDILLQDPNIDLIVVASPNASHYKIASQCLQAGKHVVVEKPFTPTSKDADELIELAKKQNKLLSVYHNRRWDSDFKTVSKVIKSNFLGNIVEYEAHFDRFRNYFVENAWKEKPLPGSGILYDLGSHLIDQALYLFGMPKEVTGLIRIQRSGGKTADNFEVILDYTSLKVTLKAGMLVKELGPHFIILGDKGSFIKHGMDVQEDALKRGESPLTIDNWGKEPKELSGTINTEIDGLSIRGQIESEIGDYRCFYKNIYKAILGEEDLNVTPEQARNVIKIIELAIKSNDEKHTIKVE